MRPKRSALVHQGDGERGARAACTGANPCGHRIKDTDGIGVSCACQRADRDANTRGGAI